MKISTPKKLEGFFMGDYRYKGLRGGRGSGKSYAAADYLLMQMIKDPNRNALCLREVQKSIKNSSKKLIEDRIGFHDLWSEFEVFQAEIKCRNGTGFITFQGLRDNTADSVKSMEAFSLVWVEESQSITQHSLDLLLPTIREDNAELIFSWNPRLRTDPIERLFKEKKNSKVIHINYPDNPFCPQVFIKEAEEMKVQNKDKYDHVYLGGYVDTTGNKLFGYSLVMDAMERKQTDVDRSGAFVISADVARYGDDSSVFFKRKGYDVYEFKSFRKINTMEYANIISNQIISDVRDPDAVFIDTIGVGSGVMDRLRELGYRAIDANVSNRADEEDLYSNKRAEMYFMLKEFMENGGRIPKDDELLEELLAVSYFFTETGKIRLSKKDDMKEELGRSPDLADALALSFYAKIRTANNNTFTNQGSSDWA